MWEMENSIRKTDCHFAELDMTVVLEVFGEYFLEYCLKHGYDKMLVTLGGDFETFIDNLDSLHALLQLSYKNIEAPSFRFQSMTALRLY